MKTIRLSNTTNPLPVVEEEPKNISFAERLKERLSKMPQEEFEAKMKEMEESCNIGPEASEFIKMQEDYIKQQDEIEADKLFLDLNSALVKFWIEKGRPSKGVKIAALERMLNWYKKMGTVVLQDVEEEVPEVDLEEATEEYIEKRASLAPDEQWDIEDMRDAVRFGAKWMKEQTKK